MSKVSITTSEYKQTKQAEIDGVDFEVRPMSSAETIALTQLSEDLKNINIKENAEGAIAKINKIGDIFFGLFTPESKARKLLEPLSHDSWFKIYEQIMKGDHEQSA